MSGVPSPPAVMSEHAQEMLKKLNRFVEEVVKPGEVQYREQHSMGKNRWACPPVMEAMKAEAKKRELWNLFVPRKFKESMWPLAFCIH
ncbi:Acyl-CoA dehydrogenase member 10 [Perkinsus olseni]|uniref:Acyl-CoA dehydrogenase member 10 n=1 Tax=Perkinsus olseni TaxID=32597 RepID=A0A7J6R394_PEROL|nr:Acyl-CoA dehydrogenase member 10 [Perkinsus olseni]KAF4715067.1 Acyl-CoA dehydrogenase member 10 [Perkinsus olseni]